MGGCIIHSPSGHEKSHRCDHQPGRLMPFFTLIETTTETKLVGVNDAMYLIIWTQLFLKGQGFKVINNIVPQDNQSAMFLEHNGKTLSSKKACHIEISYYFITDHIDRGQMSLAYCRTEAMVTDYFTKPLQGIKFQKFCAVIMNYQDPVLKYHIQ